MLEEAQEQVKILDSCTELFTPASIKKFEIKKKCKEFLLHMPHDPLAYYPYADKDFVLPVVEYSNVIYLYKVLCDKLKGKKHIEKNIKISLKNLKNVRAYISSCGLKDLHEFCNELVTHYCSSGFDQVQGFLKAKGIENKDQLYAILVASLKRYGDLLMQEFKEKAFDGSIIDKRKAYEKENELMCDIVDVRHKEMIARAKEETQRARELAQVAEEMNVICAEACVMQVKGDERCEETWAKHKEAEAKHEEVWYNKNIIEQDFRLAIDAYDDDELPKAQLLKNLELIVDNTMDGMSSFIVENEMMCNVVNFVIFGLKEYITKGIEFNSSSVQELVCVYLEEKTRKRKDENHVVQQVEKIEEVEEKKVKEYSLQDALKAAQLPDDILKQLDKNLALVKHNREDISEHYKFFSDCVKKQLNHDHADTCIAMVNLQSYSDKSWFKYQDFADVSFNLLTNENALNVLRDLSNEGAKLTQHQSKFFNGGKSHSTKLPGAHQLLEEVLTGKGDKGKMKSQLLDLQKKYIKSYSSYCDGLTEINREYQNPEIKKLLIKSRKQLEILNYESFDYIEGEVSEVLDILQMQCQYKIEEIEQRFVLPVILYSNLITKLLADDVTKLLENLNEFSEIECYLINCSQDELGKVCSYAADYYCSGNESSKTRLSNIFVEKGISRILKDEVVGSILVTGLQRYSELLRQESSLKLAVAKVKEMQEINRKTDKSQDENLRDIVKNSFMEKMPVNDIRIVGGEWNKLWDIYEICVLLSDLIVDSIMDSIYEKCQNITMGDIDAMTCRIMDKLKGDDYKEVESIYKNIYPLYHAIRATGMGGEWIYESVDDGDYIWSVEPLKKVEGFTMAIINGLVENDVMHVLHNNELWQQVSTRSLVYRTLDTIRRVKENYEFESEHPEQIKSFYEKIKQVVENIVEEEGLKIPSLFSVASDEKKKSIKEREKAIRKAMEEQIANEFKELKAELVEFENRPDVIEQYRIKAEQEEEERKIISDKVETNLDEAKTEIGIDALQAGPSWRV